jgi:chromosome segregation ATPase
MNEDVETVSPEHKAWRAAEQLAAEGLNVTAVSVRERSGVRMATAAAAARTWKAQEKEAESASTEPVPEHLQARSLAVLEGVWHEARALSRAEFDEARVSADVKLRATEDEVLKLTAVVEELEQERERFTRKATNAAKVARERADDLAAQLAAERSRADRAEGALEAVTAERDRLLDQVGSLPATTND